MSDHFAVEAIFKRTSVEGGLRKVKLSKKHNYEFESVKLEKERCKEIYKKAASVLDAGIKDSLKRQCNHKLYYRIGNIIYYNSLIILNTIYHH